MAEPSERIGELVLVRTSPPDMGGELVRRGLGDLVRLGADPRASRLVDILMGEGTWEERVTAWEELHRLGPATAGWSDLLCEASSGPDGWGRIFAAELLSWYRLCPEKSVPVLAVALGASIEERRHHWSRLCCGSLGRYPELPRELREQALSPLMAALDVPDRDVRLYAAAALASWGAGARRALVRLAACCDNADPDALARYRDALHAIDPEASDEFGVLTSALGDPDPVLRADAARILNGMGSEARPALPALLAASRDEYPPVRLHAALALGELGVPDGALPHLERLAADQDPGVHLAAVYVLVRWGEGGSPRLGQLLDALAGQDSRIRAVAARYLNELRTMAPWRIGFALKKALWLERDPDVRRILEGVVGRRG